jgi:L-arabinose isomerase
LQDEEAWSEIEAWTEAARVAVAIRNNRLGVLGHYYGGMLDVYTDLTKQSAKFGTHIELLEMCELKKYRDEVTDPKFRKRFRNLMPRLMFHRNVKLAKLSEPRVPRLPSISW